MQKYCPNNSNFTFREVVCMPCEKKNHGKNMHFDFDEFDDLGGCGQKCKPNCHNNCHRNCDCLPSKKHHDDCFDHYKKITPCGCNYLKFLVIGCLLNCFQDYPTNLEHHQQT